METGTNMGTAVPWKRMGKDRQTNGDRFGQYQTVAWPASLMLGASSYNDHPLHILSICK